MEAVISRYLALSELVPLRAIRNDSDYDEAVAALNALLDAGASREEHPLADLADVLADLIAGYDDQRLPEADVPASAILRFLMAQHSLDSAALPELGGPAVVDEVLSGTRDLNVTQINALARRFNVPGSVFLS